LSAKVSTCALAAGLALQRPLAVRASVQRPKALCWKRDGSQALLAAMVLPQEATARRAALAMPSCRVALQALAQAHQRQAAAVAGLARSGKVVQAARARKTVARQHCQTPELVAAVRAVSQAVGELAASVRLALCASFSTSNPRHSR